MNWNEACREGLGFKRVKPGGGNKVSVGGMASHTEGG